MPKRCWAMAVERRQALNWTVGDPAEFGQEETVEYFPHSSHSIMLFVG